MRWLFFIFILPALRLFSQEAPTMLWEITGNRLDAPSFLFGTIHLGDSSLLCFDPVFWKAFQSVETFAMEVLPEEVSKKHIQKELWMKDQTLTDLLSKEEYTLVEARFRKATGMSLRLFEKMKPFYLLSQAEAGFSQNSAYPPMDLFLETKARDFGKKRAGIERVKDQFRAVNALPLPLQASMLYEWAQTPDSDQQLSGLLEAYKAADFTKILNFASDPQIPAQFSKILIENRNKKMVASLVRLMKRGSVFAAVGAAHLPGKEGIINQLRAKGYRLQPVLKTQP